MLAGLRALGITCDHDPAVHEVVVHGRGGEVPARSATIDLDNSGTSIRFLAALCASAEGTYRLDGNARMRQRPIGPLLETLAQLGCDCSSLGTHGCPPVELRAHGLRGGQATLEATLSSQYLSAILMVSPLAKSPTEIILAGPLVSEPYIDMTLGVMARFGVTVDTSRAGRYVIQPATYRPMTYDIEPDASAASYFFATAAITGGSVTVQGLSEYALQGDVKFVEALELMGCRVTWGNDSTTVTATGPLRGIEVDMNAISDTAQTLAAVAVFATGPTRITNIAHVRHKETDRIAAVATELRRVGIQVEEFTDGLVIHPGQPQPGVIQTYDDHRMAMSFALLGLRCPGIVISDPGCTRKTYPGYFDDLDRLLREAGVAGPHASGDSASTVAPRPPASSAVTSPSPGKPAHG